MKVITQAIILSLLSISISQVSAGEENPGDLVVHEWGTFTTVAGWNGETVPWSPTTPDPLPGFVRRPDTLRQPVRGFATKRSAALQRMETPVIYFYSEEPRTVSVSARFADRQGNLTEWFPSADAPGALPFSVPKLHWPMVEILDPEVAVEFPHDGSKNHYYPARKTGANPIRVTPKNGEPELEKFLFYRGITQFPSPIKINPHGDGTFLQVARGEDLIESGIALQVRAGQARITEMPGMGEDRTYTAVNFPDEWEPVEAVAARIESQLNKQLISAGLYPDEAAAMIASWEDTWFHDEGIRILYIMPKSWVDRTLPLEISPAPDQIERVMVGRVEVITPEVSWQLTRGLALAADDDPEIQSKGRELISDLCLGRFAAMAVSTATQNLPPATAVAQPIIFP